MPYPPQHQVIGAVSRENIFVNKNGIYMLPSHNKTNARTLLPAFDADSSNRSSLVLAQVRPPSSVHPHQ